MKVLCLHDVQRQCQLLTSSSHLRTVTATAFSRVHVCDLCNRHCTLHIDFSALTFVLRHTSCDFTPLCLFTLPLIRKIDWLLTVIEMQEFQIQRFESPQKVSAISTHAFLSRNAKEKVQGKGLPGHVMKTRTICKICAG
jgi:hypothetical protein